MSRYTYVGDFTNPAKSFFVQEEGDGLFYVYVKNERPCDCGCPNCKGVITETRRHPLHERNPGYEEYADAEENIEAIEEFFEQDYENYLEENHYELRQQELYEQFKNEY